MEVPRDPAQFVLVPFQSARHGSQSSLACDSATYARPLDLPDAPDAPPSLALARGVNDGSWSFSKERDNQVVFILPVTFEPPHESDTKHHWLLWLQNLLLSR